MKWSVVGSLITIAMVVVAVYAKTQENNKLFWFGVLMAISFATSVAIWINKAK